MTTGSSTPRRKSGQHETSHNLWCEVGRLNGVSAQRLLSQGGQLSLFDSDRRIGRLNAALDRIHDKFGSAALTTADLHETPTRKRE